MIAGCYQYVKTSSYKASRKLIMSIHLGNVKLLTNLLQGKTLAISLLCYKQGKIASACWVGVACTYLANPIIYGQPKRPSLLVRAMDKHPDSWLLTTALPQLPDFGQVT